CARLRYGYYYNFDYW
nr:immunoglobulin heavy chain junction region [Macaca mulatta]MOW20779.1 immunoglobulin heavy chain junction region [Macaca mulatta]MOW21306.1 immunoglobulin heavy chain junction region [Macaca mulatta]MOW21896.1 immunoglobulin heavy chain junction region [Macaca mulatta]MOW21937.1 immunoglobulin heavy chain junction region [Macaca mulatta]